MNISEFCIKRPVFAIVLSLILIVLGVLSFNKLQTRFLPNINRHSVLIETPYPGASPQLVETSVTNPIELAVSKVSGIDTIKSRSKEGFSSIIVVYKYDANPITVTNDIRNALSSTVGDLPEGIKTPELSTDYGIDDVLDYLVYDPNKSLADTNDYITRHISNRIEEIPGASQVSVYGANPYAMVLELDPYKMHAYGISPGMVEDAVNNSSLNLPAGSIQSKYMDFNINSYTKLTTPKEYNNLVVKKTNNQILRFKDIGHAKIGSASLIKSKITYKNKPSLFFEIMGSDTANPINTANSVISYMKSIENQLPTGMVFHLLFNASSWMKSSIHEVYISIGIAILCVLIVIALFLGNLRTTLIPVVTIPVCLFATFAIMALLGYTINMITLLAIVLSIGLVVDDAIVMLENIYRHIERGMQPLQAAIKGSKEITFAVIAMTITLAAVYAPIGAIHNRFASVYAQFAYTLTAAVLVSGFVALTLSPMMCGRLLPKDAHHDKLSQKINRIFENFAQRYSRILNHILNHRLIILLVLVAIGVGGFFIAKTLPVTFMPKGDLSIIHIYNDTPSGSNLAYVARQNVPVEKIAQSFPQVTDTATLAFQGSGSNAMVIAMLKPQNERKYSSQQIAAMMQRKLDKIPGLNYSAVAASFGQQGEHNLQFKVLTNKSYVSLYYTVKKLIKELKAMPYFSYVGTNLNFYNQSFNTIINRNLAEQMGVSIQSIDSALQAFLGNHQLSTFDVDGYSYDVVMRAPEQLLYDPSILKMVYVTNDQGKLVPLSTFVNLKEVVTQAKLPHYDLMRSAEVDLDTKPKVDEGFAINYLNDHLHNLLPDTAKYIFTGRAEQILENRGMMGMLFGLAIIFIYLVLSAQFESFIDPIIILLAVPLAIVAALGCLKLIGGSLNIYTDIGLVTLIGLISKHGILITKFSNDLREQGVELREALTRAATIRLRPILMTTAAMVFGAMPLVFASGSSSVSRQQIGVVIVAGLLFGTFFSLVAVPVIYSYLGKLTKRDNVTTWQSFCEAHNPVKAFCVNTLLPCYQQR